MAWDPLASVGRTLNILGFWLGENCTNVHVARLSAGVHKAGLHVHDKEIYIYIYHLQAVGQMLLTMKCLQPTRLAVTRASGDHVQSHGRRRISGRAMELVNGHESFSALSNRGALSMLDASFKFARASSLVSGEPWATVRVEQRAFGGILSPAQ